MTPAERLRAYLAPHHDGTFFVRNAWRFGWVEQHRRRHQLLIPLPAYLDEFRAQGFVFAGALT